MREPLFQEIYDRLFADKDYEGEIDKLLTLARIVAPVYALDVGCGTGNHALAFASRGARVVGVDVDAHMLAVARRKQKALEAEIRDRIEFFHGRVEDLREGGFDLAFGMFNVVNYLSTETELYAWMSHIARRLQPGASFVLDAWNGEAVLRDPPRRKRFVADGVTSSLEVRIDPFRRSGWLRYLIQTADGRSAEHLIRHSLWQQQTVCAAAKVAGLQVEGVMPLDDTSRAASRSDWKILYHFSRPVG